MAVPQIQNLEEYESQYNKSIHSLEHFGRILPEHSNGGKNGARFWIGILRQK
jgi:hypothetical protein